MSASLRWHNPDQVLRVKGFAPSLGQTTGTPSEADIFILLRVCQAPPSFPHGGRPIRWSFLSGVRWHSMNSHT